MLLTRAPVAGGRIAAPPLPLDLHVLGLSLAFILSQDQTLRCCYIVLFSFLCPSPRASAPQAAGRNGADPGPFIRLRFLLHPFRSRRGLRQGGLTLLVPPPEGGGHPSSLSYRL